jgi:2'-5' RNA ligase superfamily
VVQVGTSSGRPQSALLIPVPSAEAVVGAARLEHDPVAALGVPAHVTLIVPWVEPVQLESDRTILPGLVDALTDVKCFDFALTGTGWFDKFGQKVLWLAPEPAAPFRELTALLAERFGTPPWAGKFPEVVPHLTIGHAGAGGPLEPVADDLLPKLPVTCRAEEVWAMVGDGRRWVVHAKVPLG